MQLKMVEDRSDPPRVEAFPMKAAGPGDASAVDTKARFDTDVGNDAVGLQDPFKEECKEQRRDRKPRLPGMVFKLPTKPLPFANLAPSSDTKHSLRTLTEESLRTSKLLTSQMATSIELQTSPEA